MATEELCDSFFVSMGNQFQVEDNGYLSVDQSDHDEVEGSEI